MFAKSQCLPDDHFYFSGLFFRHVALVGRVIHPNTNRNMISFDLNDNTGCAKISIVTKEGEEPFWINDIVENAYVKVYGETRSFSKSR